jgi:hypothetical protein
VGSLFSNTHSPRHFHGAPPPPPRPVSFLEEDPEPTPLPAVRPVGIRFDAELELSELDDRDRPGPTWTGQGRELGRSHLALRTRRMCYQNRRVLIAVHLIDDEPVALQGRVTGCEYDGDGMYRVELELMRVADRPEIAAWVASRQGR